MHKYLLLFLAGCALDLSALQPEDSEPSLDSGIFDSSFDTFRDVLVETSTEEDAGPDAYLEDADLEDAGLEDSDSGFDAGLDSEVDSGTDSGIDSGIDSGTDAGRDSGFDAGVDSGRDSGVDSGSSCPCAPPLTCCGGRCVDIQTDELHCGACNSACQANRECRSGMCMCGSSLCQQEYCSCTSSLMCEGAHPLCLPGT